MKPFSDFVATVYPFLENVLYSIALYKTISDRIYQDVFIDVCQRELWVNVINNSIQMAVIDWCKVFGSDYENPFHYSRNCDFQIEGIDSVKEKMTRFRNKYIAHKTTVDVPVPSLNEATNVIFAFDKEIRKKSDLDGYPTFQETYESCQIRIEDLLDRYHIGEI